MPKYVPLRAPICNSMAGVAAPGATARKGGAVSSCLPADAPHLLRCCLQVAIDDLKVMDETAVTLCKEQNIPVIVFSITERGNILRAALGEDVGTTVSNETTAQAACAAEPRGSSASSSSATSTTIVSPNGSTRTIDMHHAGGNGSLSVISPPGAPSEDCDDWQSRRSLQQI